MAETTKKEWKTIIRQQIRMESCYCYLCGKIIKQKDHWNLDHQTPVSRSGINNPTNWRPTHVECNEKKGALTYEEWLLWQELERKRFGHIK